MADFNSIPYDKAVQLIDEPENFEEIMDFLDGDHWRSGKGFIGPSETLVGDGETTDFLDGEIGKSFTSENVLGEVVARRTDGILSKRPQYSWEVARRLKPGESPTTDEQSAIFEADEVTQTWWNEKDLYAILHDFAFHLSGLTRTYLRVYIPPDRLNDDGTLKYPAKTAAEALRHIFVEHVLPDKAVKWVDRKSMFEVGVVLSEYEDEEGKKTEMLELYYLVPGRQENGKPVTRMRILTKEKTTGSGPTVDLTLNGELLLFEGRERRSFVSTQIIQNQKALNTASTEMRIVNDSEGFPLRLIFNALAPGRVTRNDDGTVHFEPDANFRFRPGSLAFFQGVETEDDNKNVKDVKDPEAVSLGGGDAQNYLNEMRARRRAILNEAKQLFVEIMDDATATGESRIHALFDYLLNAQYFKRTLDRAGAWAITTAWALARHLAGEQPTADLVVDFNCKINIPFLPAGLVDTLIKLHDNGIRSRETVMNDTGIDDILAELDRIEQTPMAKLNLEKKRAETVKAWKDAGMTLEFAGKRAGLTKEEITELQRQDEELDEQMNEQDRLQPPPDRQQLPQNGQQPPRNDQVTQPVA